ncbi:MAG: hypothetical protein WAW80_00010 [Candidatus Saccharimonadales bacterium]
MSRLPTPGGDNGNWGTILNDYLSQTHKADGTLKDNTVTSNTIAPNSITNTAIATDAVTATSIADGSITETLLDTTVQAKLNQSAPTWATLSGKPTVIASGSDQATARASIGAQAEDTDLTAIAGLTSAANKLPYATGAGTWALTDVTGFARTQLAAANALTARSVISAAGKNDIGANVLDDYSAVADGITDDRAAFISADSAAISTGLPIIVKKGIYKISSSITIASPLLLMPGAVIKPANASVVSLAGGIVNTGLYQVIDMSLNGVVVVYKTDVYHPAWWGPVGTTDDSATWNKMLVSASYLPTRQAISVPVGDNKLWQIELNNVHLEGMGRTRRIIPAEGAVAGDPVVSNTGFILKLLGSATIDGVQIDTNNVDGIVGVYWVGNRCWINNSWVKPTGVGSVGVWAYVSGGSLTPKVSNTWVEGNGASTSGTGIRFESADGELSNTTVAYCDVGIELKKGSTVLNTIHIWECNTGIIGIWASHTRLSNCYIETNFGWGATFSNTNSLVVDKGTRFWKNGTVVVGTGGLRIQGGTGTNKSKDCLINSLFDDNVGIGFKLEDTVRTRGEISFVSSEAIAGNTALTTNGVVVDSTSSGTDLTIIAPSFSSQSGGYAPWVGSAFTNASSNSIIDLGGRIINMNPRGRNLASDGDFAVPALWTDIPFGVVLSTEQKDIGARSLKVIGQSRQVWLLRTPWGGGNPTYGVISVKPGQVLKLSAKLFRHASNGATSGIYWNATFSDASGINSTSTVDNYVAQTAYSLGSWADIAPQTFTVPSGYSQVNFSFKTTGSVGANDAFYIDSLSIEEIGGNGFFTGTGTLDFGSVAAQSQVDLTITVTGAVLGDAVALGIPTAAITAGIAFTAWASAANTITIRAHNYTAAALDPASGVFKATVVR